MRAMGDHRADATVGHSYAVTEPPAPATAHLGPDAPSPPQQDDRPPPVSPHYAATVVLNEDDEDDGVDQLVVVHVAGNAPEPSAASPPELLAAVPGEDDDPCVFRLHDRRFTIARLPSYIVPRALFPGPGAHASFLLGHVVSGRGGWQLVSLDSLMSERCRQLWQGWYGHIEQSRHSRWKAAPAELFYFVLDGVTGLCFRTPLAPLQRSLLMVCSCLAN